MNNTRRMAVVGALALACAGLSLADSVTYSTSFSATTDFHNGLLTLPEFNNVSGALAGMQLLDVSLQLTVVDTVTSLSLTNNSSSPQSFSAQSYVYVDDCPAVESASCSTGNPSPVGIGPSVAGEDQISIGQLFLFNKALSLGASGGGTCNIGDPTTPSGCSAVSYTPPNIVKTASQTLDVGIVFPGDINAYYGTGNFTETAETDTFTSTGGAGGNVTFTQATTAQIFAYVTYTYQPVGAPEPATLFLMGTALVGVGLLRKRIKS